MGFFVFVAFSTINSTIEIKFGWLIAAVPSAPTF
jgi:hypothetical protein